MGVWNYASYQMYGVCCTRIGDVQQLLITAVLPVGKLMAGTQLGLALGVLAVGATWDVSLQ